MSIEHKVFRFRLEPTTEQGHALHRMAGARRFVFNWGLEARKEHYKTHGKSLKLAELGKRLTELKNRPETAWLRECDSQLLQQALIDLGRAYANFFAKRAKEP